MEARDELCKAYEQWKAEPCIKTLIGLYKNGFTKGCKWSPVRKVIRVITNILTGKYKKYYEYFTKKD